MLKIAARFRFVAVVFLSLLTIRASARDVGADAAQLLVRAKSAAGACVTALVQITNYAAFGWPAKRQFSNLTAFLENQRLIHADLSTAGSAMMFAKAYRELEPVAARDLELIYYVGDEALYVENEARPVLFKKRTVLIVDRVTHLVVGFADAELLQRVTRWTQIRMTEPHHYRLTHGHGAK